jgi:hypothetical protein
MISIVDANDKTRSKLSVQLFIELFHYVLDIFRFHFLKKKRFIFWGHLGLGDQLMMAKVYEFWNEQGSSLVIPAKKQNIQKLRQVFRYLPDIEFCEVSNDPLEEAKEVHELSKQMNLKILSSGRSRFLTLQRLYPGLGLNQILALGSLVYIPTFYSQRFRSYYLKDREPETPFDGYVFFDRKVGTPYEVASEIMESNSNKRLFIIENDIRIPFEKLGKIMDSAEELHLVGSAPLCLALILGTETKLNLHYVNEPQQWMKGDAPSDRWKTFDLKSKTLLYSFQNISLFETWLESMTVYIFDKLKWVPR